MNRIYFDNAATTPLLPQVRDVITHHLEHSFGNPSSLHREGRLSRTVVEEARRKIAGHLNASIGEIFFTSCGTESNNTILIGAVEDLGIRRIVSSRVEHPCVLRVLERLSGRIDIKYVKLDDVGRADQEDLERLLKDDAHTLVSLMHVNNETGAVNDIETIGNLCRASGALFHTDTVQGIGYFPYDLTTLNIDFMSASAHKFHGPKGVGFLYIRADHAVSPFLLGGGQERNMRAGTENIAYIAGMSTALELAYKEFEERKSHITHLRQYLVDKLQAISSSIEIINPSGAQGHYKILVMTLPLNEKTTLAIPNLDIAGIAVSGGSACSSGAEKGSHVFDSLYPGLDKKTIRVSFSHLNTTDEVDILADKLKTIF